MDRKNTTSSATRNTDTKKIRDNSNYNELIVESYKTPEMFNVLATIFLWTLLAGFVVFPGTFTSLRNTSSLNSSVPGRVVQRTIQNIPLLAVAAFFFVLGTAGIGWLWHQRRRHYLWLADKLFLYVATRSICIQPLSQFR